MVEMPYAREAALLTVCSLSPFYFYALQWLCEKYRSTFQEKKEIPDFAVSSTKQACKYIFDRCVLLVYCTMNALAITKAGEKKIIYYSFFLNPPSYPKIQDSFSYNTQKYSKLEQPDA